MKLINVIARRLASIIKLVIIKILHPLAIKTKYTGNLSASTHFRINKGHITFKENLNTRRNVEFSVSENGIINIGKNCFFNNNCLIVAHDKIQIGDNCSFGPNTMIFDHDHDFRKVKGIKAGFFKSNQVTIEDGVWLGANVTILKGVKIGKNTIIAANSIVVKDVPANTIYYLPLTPIIKEYKNENYDN